MKSDAIDPAGKAQDNRSQSSIVTLTSVGLGLVQLRNELDRLECYDAAAHVSMGIARISALLGMELDPEMELDASAL